MKNSTQILQLINGHKQVFPYSCVPMAIECILKLLKLMPISDFSLQLDSSKSLQSNWIKNGFVYPNINPQVKFNRQFKLGDIGLEDRGEHFMKDYFDDLFKVIDTELENDRYVFISLQSAPTPTMWHMYVIFDKNEDNTYQTLTFIHNNPNPIFERKDLKKIVTDMKGTDIITYTFIK